MSRRLRSNSSLRRKICINLISDDEDEDNTELRKAAVVSSPDVVPTAVVDNDLIELNSQESVMQEITLIFPDICPEYALSLYQAAEPLLQVQGLAQRILEDMDAGKPIPKAEVEQPLKRKRSESYKSEDTRTHVVRNGNSHKHEYMEQSFEALYSEFPSIPKKFITTTYKSAGQGSLISTYQILERAERTLSDVQKPPYVHLKTKRLKLPKWHSEAVDSSLLDSTISVGDRMVREDLKIARRATQKAANERERIRTVAQAEIDNETEAVRDGTMSECGCCFSDYPLNRMVHCDSEQDIHWFCRECAQQLAESNIGDQKHKLCCMSMDGCAAEIARGQIRGFISKTSLLALERLEQECSLREAGIENFAACPFCPYGAEYPSVEEEKEFRCLHPDCLRKSCRLCNKDSHIPLTCRESSKQNGLNHRREIEEAMSAALIRQCNKCQSPFIKLEGCNKMTCTTCKNVQCYICSKNAAYDHFDDVRRGGKPNNCPLFDKDIDLQHEEDVAKAEKNTRAKVLAEQPDVIEEDLMINMNPKLPRETAKPAARPAAVPRALPPLPRPRPVGANWLDDLPPQPQQHAYRRFVRMPHENIVRREMAPQAIGPPVPRVEANVMQVEKPLQQAPPHDPYKEGHEVERAYRRLQWGLGLLAESPPLQAASPLPEVEAHALQKEGELGVQPRIPPPLEPPRGHGVEFHELQRVNERRARLGLLPLQAGVPVLTAYADWRRKRRLRAFRHVLDPPLEPAALEPAVDTAPVVPGPNVVPL